MSQEWTDDVYDANHVGATDLENIEKNFACLKSGFSGSSAPSNPVAGMWWYDTTTHIVKIRNEANDNWLSVWDLANNKPIIANLSNEITVAMIAASAKDPAAGTAGLRTLGTGSALACAGNDSRLSDARTPTGSGVVTQAMLKTSQGSVSTSGDQQLTLPGGEYGFYPQFKGVFAEGTLSGFVRQNLGSTYLTTIRLVGDSTCYAQQRYVTSSGEVHWVFILRDKTTKKILSVWQAPDHPCFGNGGKPLLVPHPFGDYDPEKHEIVVLNPTTEQLDDIRTRCIVEDELSPDKDMIEVILEDYEIDEESEPAWPEQAVTVGLPKSIDHTMLKIADLTGEEQIEVTPIKKVIPKPDYVIAKSLKLKEVA